MMHGIYMSTILVNRQDWDCYVANTSSDTEWKKSVVCAVFFSSSLFSSSFSFFFFFQSHSSEVFLVAGSVWAHLAMILPQTEAEATLASVSTGIEATGEMPLGVVTAVVKHWLLTEVGLRTLHSRTSVAAVVN